MQEFVVVDERNGKLPKAHPMRNVIDGADVVVTIQQDGIFVTRSAYENQVGIVVVPSEAESSLDKATAQREARQRVDTPAEDHITRLKRALHSDEPSQQRTVGDQDNPDATTPRDPWS